MANSTGSQDEANEDGDCEDSRGVGGGGGVASASAVAAAAAAAAAKRQKKRGIFPKVATNIMRAWLFQHLSVSVLYYR